MTAPEATELLTCCVTVPTTSTVPVIAAVAAACVWPTTFGTATCMGAVELKVAVTNWPVFATTSHEPVPLHGPLQPANADPEEAMVLRLTAVPAATLSSHAGPQVIPKGLLVTVPLPVPASNTPSVCVVAMPPPSITVRFPVPVFAT